MNIRQADINDVEQLITLIKKYRIFYNAEDKSDIEIEHFLRQRISGNESVVFVAEHDEILVAYTQLFPSFSTIGLYSIWILNDLFVSNDYRKQGIAEKLLESVIAYAEQTNRKQIWLLTAGDNYNAQQLYLKKGFLKTKFQHYAYKF